jgi:hypothetical protein
VAKPGNAGEFRDKYFCVAFPKGLTIGCSKFYTLTFTSAKAIEDFLPQKSTAGKLSHSYTDPTETEAGSLAGNVLALGSLQNTTEYYFFNHIRGNIGAFNSFANN